MEVKRCYCHVPWNKDHSRVQSTSPAFTSLSRDNKRTVLQTSLGSSLSSQDKCYLTGSLWPTGHCAQGLWSAVVSGLFVPFFKGTENVEKTEWEKTLLSGLGQVSNQGISSAVSQTKLPLKSVICDFRNPLKSQIMQLKDSIPRSATSSPMICCHLPGLVFTCAVNPLRQELTQSFCSVYNNGSLIFIPAAATSEHSLRYGADSNN